ncbi:MAG: glycosyltransferase family 4 protein [Prevotellaceae bacterium]|jgi:glycosyltransferase involved in cell wall biosynthesis|nr:glycosyltransferase family 4 protein [Prevotellaceae bacterium]
MKKKILIIGNGLCYGGAEYYISDILSRLSGDFDILYLVADKTLMEKLQSTGGKVAAFSTHTFVRQMQEVRSAIRREKPDIALLNGGNGIFFTPFLRGVKKIIVRHSTNRVAVCRVPNNNFFQLLYRTLYVCLLHAAYFFSDAVVHVSNYSMKEQKLFRRRAVCIHNGLPDAVSPERKVKLPVRFLFLGRIETFKGIDVVAEAFQKISGDVASIDIVGAGAYSDQLLSINKKNIRYHGFQNDTGKYYQNSDVFILFSICENCPFGVIDALRYAMPVVTTGVGGVGEMVFDGVNGLVIPKTAEAMVAAAEKLAKNPEVIPEMGQKSRQIFERSFTLERAITQLAETINKL